MPKLWPTMQHSHYAKWMGGGMWYYPADMDTFRFFRNSFMTIGLQMCGFIWLTIYIEKRTVSVSPLRPEWHSSFVSDLEFNPPLWHKEPPGTIPYFRTVEIEDTWEKVEQVRGKHWTDDYVYTKPWEADDGQYRNRSPNHKSYIL